MENRLPHQKSKRRLWLILPLIFLWLFGAFLVGFFLSSGEKPSFSLSFIKPKKQFKTKLAEPQLQFSKSKKIGADGGSISIVDAKGTKITLMVPPKAIAQETEIKLSSLPTPPVDNLQVNEDSPGVLIEPVSLHLAIPGTLIFDFDSTDDASASATAGVVNASLPLPSIQPELGNDQNLVPVTPPQVEPELTAEEQERRRSAPRRQPGRKAGVVHTDSSTTQTGSVVIYTPSNTNQEKSQTETQVNTGGSYNFDDQVAAEEAKENINQVLNNPNATFEEVLEAAKLAQAWGFDELDQKAKSKLKEKINQAADDVEKNCQDGKPKSKQKILEWQGLAQALGFEEETSKFDQVFQTCRRRHYIHFILASAWGRTDIFDATVCGFVDDLWQGKITLEFHYECGGGNGEVDPFTFSLPPEGGRKTIEVPWTGWASVCGTGVSLPGGVEPITIDYHGNNTATFSPAGTGPKTVSIQTEGPCPGSANDLLPPLEPIPTEDSPLPSLVPIPVSN